MGCKLAGNTDPAWVPLPEGSSSRGFLFPRVPLLGDPKRPSVPPSWPPWRLVATLCGMRPPSSSPTARWCSPPKRMRVTRRVSRAPGRSRPGVVAAVARNGHALVHACSELRANRDFVLAAVAHNGFALQRNSGPTKPWCWPGRGSERPGQPRGCAGSPRARVQRCTGHQGVVDTHSPRVAPLYLLLLEVATGKCRRTN